MGARRGGGGDERESAPLCVTDMPAHPWRENGEDGVGGGMAGNGGWGGDGGGQGGQGGTPGRGGRGEVPLPPTRMGGGSAHTSARAPFLSPPPLPRPLLPDSPPPPPFPPGCLWPAQLRPASPSSAASLPPPRALARPASGRPRRHHGRISRFAPAPPPPPSGGHTDIVSPASPTLHPPLWLPPVRQRVSGVCLLHARAAAPWCSYAFKGGGGGAAPRPCLCCRGIFHP